MIFVYYAEPPHDYLCIEAERIVAMQGVVFEQVDKTFAVVVTHYVPVENSSSNPAETFSVMKSSLQGINHIVGFMHSHDSDEYEPTHSDFAGLPQGQIGAVWCDGDVRWYTHGDEDSVLGIAREE